VPLPFGPTIGEKGNTLGKIYGIKARCFWEHPWGTHWESREHIWNIMGTLKEQRKNEKKSSRHTQNLKEKKIKAH
jgi:hypothetical protein